MSAIRYDIHRLKCLRKQVFSTPLDLDQELIQMVAGVESHRFLTNPASHLVYLYLVKFIQACSEFHFGQSIQDLTLLDWGCGKGHTTYLLRKLGAQPISCDLREGQADSSFHQETPIIDQTGIRVEGLEHEYLLPYPAASMDVVISMGVLEHVADDLASLQEIHRILRPGGLFFCFFLPQWFSWTQRVAHLRGIIYHDRLYHRPQVEAMLSRVGYRVLECWSRQLLPKNSIRYPLYGFFERMDQWLTANTPLKYLATNLEFVACKIP